MFDHFDIYDDKDCMENCYTCPYATYTYEDYAREIAGCKLDRD